MRDCPLTGVDRCLAVISVCVVGCLLASPIAQGQTSLSIDVKASKDSSTASSSISTATFSTSTNKELLLAFVSTDSPGTPNTTVTALSGGGLAWQLVQRTNVQLGTAEIWRAFATTRLSNAKVTATLSQSVASSLTVVS